MFVSFVEGLALAVISSRQCFLGDVMVQYLRVGLILIAYVCTNVLYSVNSIFSLDITTLARLYIKRRSE
jgi:hypothetical protein